MFIRHNIAAQTYQFLDYEIEKLSLSGNKFYLMAAENSLRMAQITFNTDYLKICCQHLRTTQKYLVLAWAES